VPKPVAFDIVRFPFDDRIQEILEFVWVHLAISSHDGDDLCFKGYRLSVSRRDRGTHTAVDPMPNEVHCWMSKFANHLCGGIGRRVVDDEHDVDIFWQSQQDLCDKRLLVVGWNDDCDSLVAKHGSSVVSPRPLFAKRLSYHGR
jgi:hypothetical protein